MNNVLFGQNFRFGFYEVRPDERMRAIKNAGFDAVMFWWGEEYEDTDSSRYELFSLAEQNGLTVSTVHFPTTNSDYLWYDGLKGESYIEQFHKALDDCKARGIKNIVMHTTKKLITPPPNQIGLDNFGKILKKAEECQVKLAVENTRFLNYNRLLYETFQSEMMGFCYDCGHNNCFTPKEAPLDEFHKYLCTTHIHDNDGTADQHRPMLDGTVNYEKVFTELNKYGAKELNLETYHTPAYSKFGQMSMEEYLKMSYDTLTATAKKFGF